VNDTAVGQAEGRIDERDDAGMDAPDVEIGGGGAFVDVEQDPPAGGPRRMHGPKGRESVADHEIERRKVHRPAQRANRLLRGGGGPAR